jgi:hypothetical protein
LTRSCHGLWAKLSVSSCFILFWSFISWCSCLNISSSTSYLQRHFWDNFFVILIHNSTLFLKRREEFQHDINNSWNQHVN